MIRWADVKASLSKEARAEVERIAGKVMRSKPEASPVEYVAWWRVEVPEGFTRRECECGSVAWSVDVVECLGCGR